MIPHIKTKNKPSFATPLFKKLSENAISVPIDILIIHSKFHLFILLPTNKTDAIISPKKNAQINIGKFSNKYSNKLAILKTLTKLPPNIANKNIDSCVL